MVKQDSDILNQPDVHEAESPDIRGILMREESHHLLPGELQGKQLVQQAECAGYYTPSSHTSNLKVKAK